jgi:hypothetical protein
VGVDSAAVTIGLAAKAVAVVHRDHLAAMSSAELWARSGTGGRGDLGLYAPQLSDPLPCDDLYVHVVQLSPAASNEQMASAHAAGWAIGLNSPT